MRAPIAKAASTETARSTVEVSDEVIEEQQVTVNGDSSGKKVVVDDTFVCLAAAARNLLEEEEGSGLENWERTAVWSHAHTSSGIVTALRGKLSVVTEKNQQIYNEFLEVISDSSQKKFKRGSQREKVSSTCH